MGDKIVAVLGTLAIATVVTAMVLPGRQTPQLVRSIGLAFADASRAATGRG